jgi:hypothetical protein
MTIVVIFEVPGEKAQMDGFADDVEIFNKNGFIKVETKLPGNRREFLAMYNPDKVIAIRKLILPEPIMSAANDPNLEALHPGNGTEEREDSADR